MKKDRAEVREEAKKTGRKKARMNLLQLHYTQLSFKLNFTLSSKYEYYYTKGRTQEEKGE